MGIFVIGGLLALLGAAVGGYLVGRHSVKALRLENEALKAASVVKDAVKKIG